LNSKPDDSVAIIDFDGTEYSYSQLRSMSSMLAQILIDHGVSGGDRVVIVSENSAMYAISLFAISEIGAWSVLVNARQSITELDAIIKHSEPTCVVVYN
jgi:acyl-CoA synthetase (AMP-forming)/AMP-acid ligase II